MPESENLTLVVGGGSRIATALAPLLGAEGVQIVRRPSGQPSDIIVDDYGNIPPIAFRGVNCVINCVGVSSGTSANLRRINVDIPKYLAVAAKSAGVKRFIQISSFSVYGGAHLIDRSTQTAPASDYGHSKLAADQALLELSDNRFAVTLLRLPLIYGNASLGKLGQMLRLWRRAHVFPVPARDVSRAMIGVELAAEVIARLRSDPQVGVAFAADPLHFSYTEAAKVRRERLHILPVPRAVTRLVERVLPAIGNRLFADSRLMDSDNLAIAYGLRSRLYEDIGAAAID